MVAGRMDPDGGWPTDVIKRNAHEVSRHQKISVFLLSTPAVQNVPPDQAGGYHHRIYPDGALPAHFSGCLHLSAVSLTVITSYRFVVALSPYAVIGPIA
jgi:hypothetical protein